MTNEIILDTRERHENSESACLKSAFDRYGIKYTLKMIPVGDVLITNPVTGSTLVCERKQIKDFVDSTMSGRLHSEIDKMNTTYERSILIVEGSWEQYTKDRNRLKKAKYIKNPNFFTSAHKMGILSSITLRTNTKILFTADMDETIQLVNCLSSKFEDGRVFSVPQYKRAKTEEKIYINMLMAYPGISEAKAEHIIKSYPTWAIFSSSILNKSFKLDKIGEKTIDMFYKSLI